MWLGLSFADVKPNTELQQSKQIVQKQPFSSEELNPLIYHELFE